MAANSLRFCRNLIYFFVVIALYLGTSSFAAQAQTFSVVHHGNALAAPGNQITLPSTSDGDDIEVTISGLLSSGVFNVPVPPFGTGPHVRPGNFLTLGYQFNMPVTVRFAITFAEDAGRPETYQIRVDGVPQITAAVDATYTLTGQNFEVEHLSGGSAWLMVVTVDTDTADNTPPAAPTLVNTGNADGTVTASGIAEPGSTVTVTFPSGEAIPVVADAVTGAYSATSTQNQQSGNVTAQAADAAGNNSPVTTEPYTVPEFSLFFGAIPIGALHDVKGRHIFEPQTFTYTIRNTGQADLDITSITAASVPPAIDAATFSIGALSPAGPIAPGGSATFDVNLTLNQFANFNLPIRIANNDLDRNPFSFLIAGGATQFADPTNANTTISATTPVVANGVATSDITVQLADRNGNLMVISGGTVTLSATGSAVVGPVTNNGDGTYTATMTNTVGETVTLSGALNGNPITNTTTALFLGPEIDVSSSESGGSVADNGTDAQGNEEAGAAKTITYTVSNAASATTDLILGGTPTVSGETNIGGSVTVSAPGSLTIAPGASTTFTVTYTPATIGAFSFDLDIASNDLDENPYDIAVSGTAIDTTPPAAPTIDSTTANPNGTVTVAGTAEPGSTVTIVFPNNESVVVTADPGTGAYSATSTQNQPSGEITAQARDAENNASPITSVNYVDGTAPAAPTIDSTTANPNGTVTATGVAEPGSTVTVTFPSGETAQVLANATSGAYSATSVQNQPSGPLTAQARDAENNASPITSVNYVDGTAPAAPTIDSTTANPNGTVTVDGTAEPGSTVTIVFPNNESVVVTADPGTGAYSATSTQNQPSGQITAQARDAENNASPITSVNYVDGTAPAAPTANATVNQNASIEVTGTAEPGSTVEVTFPNGVTQTVQADPSTGEYSIVSGPGQPSGDVIVVARDAANNASPPTTIPVITDQTPPEAEITGAPASVSAGDTFTITITFSEDVTGFDATDINIANGSVTGFSGSGSVYTATISTNAQGDVSLSIPANVAQDAAGNGNTASSAINISDQTVEETVGQVGQLLGARGRLILQHQPDRIRRIDRLEGRVHNNGGVSGFGLTIKDDRLPFSARVGRNEQSFSYSLQSSRASNRQRSVTANPVAVLGEFGVRQEGPYPEPVGNGYYGPYSGVSGHGNHATSKSDLEPVGSAGKRQDATASKTDRVAEPASYTADAANRFDEAEQSNLTTSKPFDIWIEGRFSRFDVAQGDGRFAVLHAGMDYLVSSNLLLGLGFQTDWTELDADNGGQTSGHGFLLTPYLTAKLAQGFYFDARAGWGRSYNEISPFGTYTDDFGGERFLATAALVGAYDLDELNVSPRVRVTYYKETTDSYLDSLGVTIPSVEVETGEFEFGPTFSREFDNDGTSYAPFITLEGIWTFAQRNTAASVTNQFTLASKGVRARIEGGLRIFTQNNTSLSFSGNYDGIGDDNFESWGFKARVGYKF